MSHPYQRRVSLVIDDQPITNNSTIETAQSNSSENEKPRGSIPMTCSLVYIRKKFNPEYTPTNEDKEHKIFSPPLKRASTYPSLNSTKFHRITLMNNQNTSHMSDPFFQYNTIDKTSKSLSDSCMSSNYVGSTLNDSYYNSTEYDSEKESLFDKTTNYSPITEDFANYDPFKVIDSKIQTDRRKSVEWFNNEIEQQLKKQSFNTNIDNDKVIPDTSNDDDSNIHHIKHHHHCLNEAVFSPTDKLSDNDHWSSTYHIQSDTNNSSITQFSNTKQEQLSQPKNQRKRRDRHRRRLTCAVIFKSPRVVEI